MYHKLSENVYFGNWEAPFECSQANAVINVAHHFNPSRGRNVYWQRLEGLPWTTAYYRLALKDRHDVTDEYMRALICAVEQAVSLGKLPILTHCQMGGHRGPSSAICAEWVLNGKSLAALETAHRKVLELCPGLAKGGNYYHSLVAWCRRHST